LTVKSVLEGLGSLLDDGHGHFEGSTVWAILRGCEEEYREKNVE
jgi:hypothetical protein